MFALRPVTGDRVSVDWGARGGWRSGRVTAATSELDGVRLHAEYEEPLPRGGWSCRHEQSKTVMRLLAEEVESCELRADQGEWHTAPPWHLRDAGGGGIVLREACWGGANGGRGGGEEG